ncbi:hypothetical protein [Yeosuana marina]
MRIHIKRLSRKTLCSYKSLAMLEACLGIYFYAQSLSKITLEY